MKTTMEQNKNRRQVGRRAVNAMMLVMQLLVGAVAGQVWGQESCPTDVTGYKTIHVSIPATSYDDAAGGPQMPAVKYNKKYPLVISSDDMGKSELTNNWAEVNGYPNINDSVDIGIQPGSTRFLQMPYKRYYMQGKSSDAGRYAPMTFTDNVGKEHRYILTSALMPYDLAKSNYSKVNGNDIRVMRRTGWSFAQHDVDSLDDGSGAVATITRLLQRNSDTWTDSLGTYLKVLVEPNGNHDYLAAAKASPEFCMSLFQNATGEYPLNSLAVSDWTHSRTDWTAGGRRPTPTGYTDTPAGGYRRYFFQGYERAWKSEISGADNTAIHCGGTHGLGSEIKSFIRTESNVRDQAWVAGADELWEYYHIYNNMYIDGTPTFSDGRLEFDIKFPEYRKPMYRELTLNIPGLSGGGAPTFTTDEGLEVVTGGHLQTDEAGVGYTMNIGMEPAVKTYISELLDIYYADQDNAFVRRDIQYLINLLQDGTAKTGFQNSLDSPAAAHAWCVTSSVGTTIAAGTTSAATRQYARPKYILHDGTLYTTAANSAKPFYVGTASTTAANTVGYTAVDVSGLAVDGSGVTPQVVEYVEGEDMAGVYITGADYDFANTGEGRYLAMAATSGALAGVVGSGTPATASTTLERGKYKAVIGYGESNRGQGTYTYSLSVGDKPVYSFTNQAAANQAVTEFTSEEFEVAASGLPVTIATDFAPNSAKLHESPRWIDYVYFVKTGSLSPVAPGVTLAKSTTSATVKTGNSVTLTAGMALNGGTDGIATRIYKATPQGETGSETYAKDGEAVAAGAQSATYDFTPSEAGTYYFLAEATTNVGTTLTATPLVITAVADIDNFTLKIVDKSGNIALTTQLAGSALTTADPLPDKLRSPFAQNYRYYNTQAEARANSGQALTSTAEWAQDEIFVGYDVDETKMAAAKEHVIHSGSSKVFMHPVYRGQQSNSNQFLYRYRMNHQKYDQENANGLTPNEANAGNLPFVDQVYMWSLGTDPYHVMLTNNHIDGYKYVKTTFNEGNYSTAVDLVNAESSGSVYSLLYWNGDTGSDYVSLRYLGEGTVADAYKTDTGAWYLYYDSGDNGRWRLSSNSTAIGDNYKFVVKTPPSLNVNVVNAAGAVEYTLKGYYVEGATVPAYTPFFLQRSYTSNHKYYYDSTCKQYATPGQAVDVSKFDGANIYVRYTLSSDWNTDELFKVSDAGNANYCLLKYTANTSTPYLAVDGSRKVIGVSASSGNTAHWALYGTPYALRIESQANSGYYVGIPEQAVWSTNPQVYNAFSGIISTWELAAYTNSNISQDYRSLPVIRPQGSISREAPLLHLRPNGTAAALSDHDDNQCRVTFEDAAKVTLVVVDKSGREVLSETVGRPAISNTGGDPLSAGLRSPYAKNYSYYDTKDEARLNSGTALDMDALLQRGLQTVYVGYDAITAGNAGSGETVLRFGGEAVYRIRRNTNNTKGMHAVFGPGQTTNQSTYGWLMNNQKYDYQQNNEVNYNTLPFVDRTWAWELVSDQGDPYHVKLRNKATGMYLCCENNVNRGYNAIFTGNADVAAVYSFLTFSSGTNYLAIYADDGNIGQKGYLYYNDGDDGTWRLRQDTRNLNNSGDEARAYMRLEPLDEPLDIHIVAPAGTPRAGEVEATIHGYRNSNVGANTVAPFVPYFLRRAYTAGQRFYYSQEAAAAYSTDTIAAVAAASIADSYGDDGVNDVYVGYALDGAKWLAAGTTPGDEAKAAGVVVVKPYYSSEHKVNWYGIRSSSANYLKAASDVLPAAVTRTTTSPAGASQDAAASKLAEWAFIGTPYNVQIAERANGLESFLGMEPDAVSGSRSGVYAGGTDGKVTSFEIVTGLAGSTKLFIRPQGALNAQSPYVYLGGSDDNMTVSRMAGGNQALDVTWVTEEAMKNHDVTYHIRENRSGQVVSITVACPDGGDAAVLPVTLQRRGTKNVTVCSRDDYAAAIEPGTTLFSESGPADIYVSYDINYDTTGDDAANAVVDGLFTAEDESTVGWFTMRNGSALQNYVQLRYEPDMQNDTNIRGSWTGTPEKQPETGENYQWALVGTPYSFRIVNRKAGTTLRAAAQAAAAAQAVRLTADAEAYPLSTWELAVQDGMSDSTLALRLTDGGTLNLASKYGSYYAFLEEDILMTFRRVATTHAVTCYLFDEDRRETMEQLTLVEHGTALTQLPAAFLRRFCEYDVYSDDAMLTPLAYPVTVDGPMSIYARWHYADDAPVFSQGTDSTQYQYYSMRVQGATQGATTYFYSQKMNDSNGTLSQDATTSVVADATAQWAFVGTPYDMKLYNRGTQAFLKVPAGDYARTNGFSAIGQTPVAAEADSWQLPPCDGDVFLFQPELKDYPGRYLGATTLATTPVNHWTQHLVLPLTVTLQGDRVDGCEFVIDLFTHGTADALQNMTTAVKPAGLGTNGYPTPGADNRRNYRYPLWKHAFCNYEFYTDSLMEQPVAAGGLPVFGGRGQQRRALYATYTVDTEQFAQVYLLNFPNSAGVNYYIGKAENTAATTATTDKELAKSKDTKQYKWAFTGNPYQMQITSQMTGTNTPLANREAGGGESPTVVNGKAFQLTADPAYRQNYEWEIIDRGGDSVMFYLRKDGVERYTYGISTYGGQGGQALLVGNGMSQYPGTSGIYATVCRLDFAYPQYHIVWNVTDPETRTVWAQATREHIVENRVLTPADMPESLKRHFLEYTSMYANLLPADTVVAGGTAAYAETDLLEGASYTVGQPLPGGSVPAEESYIYLYLPFSYEAGAPRFYDGADADGGDTWYMMHIRHNLIGADTDKKEAATMTYSADGVETARQRAAMQWRLVGNPYRMQLVNRAAADGGLAERYLTFDGSGENDLLTLTTAGDGLAACMEALDDVTGDMAMLRSLATGGTAYVGAAGKVFVKMRSNWTSTEFLSTRGFTGINFRLHYADASLRPDSAMTDVANRLSLIELPMEYVAEGKDFDDVLPERWKRAYCDYTYTYGGKAYATVEPDIVEAATASGAATPVIDVSYRFDESSARFKFGSQPANADSTYHWYYLVNNNYQSVEQGKMVFLQSDADGADLFNNTGLLASRLYTSNYEWCVIGDPYGFRLLNRYDPDRRLNDYIGPTALRGSQGGTDLTSGYLARRRTSQGGADILEMRGGKRILNGSFWVHPVAGRNSAGGYYLDEEETQLSAMTNNYNGTQIFFGEGRDYGTVSGADDPHAAKFYNYRLEIQTDTVLKECVKHRGFVGALNNRTFTADEEAVIAAVLSKTASGEALTQAERVTIHDLMDVPANTVVMKQGYYRIIPAARETDGRHYYVQGYLDDAQRHGNAGGEPLPVVGDDRVEYDPATIFWFDYTQQAVTRYPRYLVHTQGLNLGSNGLGEAEGYEVRYEDLGAAITQLRVSDAPSRQYLSCATTGATSTDQSFDQQNGVYKTRFYLQPVGTGNNELPFKMTMSQGHNGTPLLEAGSRYGSLPYTYTSLYVPFDLEAVDKTTDLTPFVALTEHSQSAHEEEETYYQEGEKSLFCQSIDSHQAHEEWKGSNSYVPAATPVVFRSRSGLTDVTFVIPTDAPSAPIAGNVLDGSYLKVTGNTDRDLCLFGKESVVDDNGSRYTGRVGFFPRYFEGATTRVAVPANKAVYKTPSVSAGGARGIFFEFDTSGVGTGVGTVRRPAGDTLYDLQGRRVGRASRPGVYIMNGRKVIKR